ncbi:MAG: DUF6456 domain-containing protein [Allorhizobium sp.]
MRNDDRSARNATRRTGTGGTGGKPGAAGAAPAAPGSGTPHDRRLLVRVLKLALRGPLTIAAGEGTAVELAGAEGRVAGVPLSLLRLAVADGLLVREASRIRAAEAARSFLRRALTEPDEEAFLDQHRDTAVETLVEEGRSRPVLRNLAESPLSRLKDRSGQAFFPEDALQAGERLCADFTRAGLQPRLSASWEPRLSSRVKGQPPAAVEIADSALAARARLTAAISAMGPELSGVALDICCFMKGLETVERERQWPARSAKLMLRAALLALARHYAPPPVRTRSRHHWGTEDFRPQIG